MSTLSHQLGSRVLAAWDAPAEARALTALRVGSTATLAGFDARLPQPSARRFFDLGFTPGTSIEVLRRAPFGGPIVVRVADTEIALRRADAACLLTVATA